MAHINIVRTCSFCQATVAQVVDIFPGPIFAHSLVAPGSFVTAPPETLGGLGLGISLFRV